eukprot:835084-Prorocentrum_lima.AAC.1
MKVRNFAGDTLSKVGRRIALGGGVCCGWIVPPSHPPALCIGTFHAITAIQSCLLVHLRVCVK